MDQVSGISNLVAFIAGLSVATERVTEFLKSIPGVSAFLSTPQRTPLLEDIRVSAVHLLAAIVGSALCSQMPPEFLTSLHPLLPRTWATYALFGVMASGGASFWNSALDTLRAVKTLKQDLASGGAAESLPAPPAASGSALPTSGTAPGAAPARSALQPVTSAYPAAWTAPQTGVGLTGPRFRGARRSPFTLAGLGLPDWVERARRGADPGAPERAKVQPGQG